MRGIENKELNARIVKNWMTGKYQTYVALAMVMHQKHPKIVERAVKNFLKDANIPALLWQFHNEHPIMPDKRTARIFNLKPDDVIPTLEAHQIELRGSLNDD